MRVGDVPMEDVHLRRRHAVYRPLYVRHWDEVPRSVQNEAPVLVHGAVSDLGPGDQIETALIPAGVVRPVGRRQLREGFQSMPSAVHRFSRYMHRDTVDCNSERIQTIYL